MENKLEWLLNSLIEKGWEPFGIEGIVKVDMSREHYGIDFENSKGYALASEVSPRQLTSKESGLWQFVCENGMIDNLCETRYWRNHFELDEIEYNQPDYQYWIIESALKDESELEDFLLQNIKVEGLEK